MASKHNKHGHSNQKMVSITVTQAQAALLNEMVRHVTEQPAFMCALYPERAKRRRALRAANVLQDVAPLDMAQHFPFQGPT